MYLNKYERKIKKLLKNSGKKETQKLQIAYIAQMFILTLFSMFAFGISNITNENLSENDLQQMTAILSSIIIVSIIIMAFFQWILSMQMKALYDVRKKFNNSLLLMGTPKQKIIKIYFYEWLSMHILTLFLGSAAGELFYIFMSRIIGIAEKVIPYRIIIFCIILDTVLSCAFFVGQINFDISKNVIDRIQERETRIGTKSSERANKSPAINIIVAVVIGLLVYTLSCIIKIRQIKELLKLGYIVSVLLLYNLIVPIFYRIIALICKKRKFFDLLLANQISQGSFRKIKVTCMFLILSSTLFIGLHTMFSKVREAGENIANEHIKYNNVLIYSEIKTYTEDPLKDVFYGLDCKGKTESGSNVWIKGVTSEYIDQYEKFEILPSYEDEFINLCKTADNNSVFLPELYASEKDVGKNIIICFNGRKYEFKIAGLYYSNDFSKLTCLANLDYLKKIFVIDSKEYNSVYNKVDTSENDYPEYYNSKRDIEKHSREKAVSGTELVEAITYILLCCAIFSLLIYYSLVSAEGKMTVIRCRAIGMSAFKIVKIYLYHALYPVAISFVFAIPIIYIFTRICCYTMLAPYYFENVKYNGLNVTIAVGVLFTLISVTAQIFNISKYVSKKNYIEILKNPMY